MIRRGTAAFGICLAVTLGGCGIPQQDHPHVIRDGDVPFGLLERPDPTTAGSTTAVPTTAVSPAS